MDINFNSDKITIGDSLKKVLAEIERNGETNLQYRKTNFLQHG